MKVEYLYRNNELGSWLLVSQAGKDPGLVCQLVGIGLGLEVGYEGHF